MKMKAFTLIETLIVIVIFVLVLGAMTALIIMGYQTHSFAFQQSQAIEEARRGIETMVKEVREARPGDDGSYIIERAEDFEFIFYSDIDKDGAIERVRYFVQGDEFKKGVIDPRGWPIKYKEEDEKFFLLSKYVRNQPPIFRYFDGDLNELPPPARLKDSKLMQFYLEINVDPSRLPEDFSLQSAVQLRNLKENL